MNLIRTTAKHAASQGIAKCPGTTIKASLAASLLLSGHVVLGSDYELQIDPDDPASGVLRLTLEAPLKHDTVLITRQMGPERGGLAPRCDNLNATLDAVDPGWRAPAGCSAISWSVSFTTVEAPATNVAQQVNLHYSDQWWLLTEWGSVLRPESQVTSGSVCARIGDESTCRLLPELSEPPLILVAGEPDDTYRFGEITLRLFHALLPTGFSPELLEDSLEQQATYLTSLVPSAEESGSVPSEIDILMLGIDESLEVVGGAAGHTAYLANVAVAGDSVSTDSLLRTLWITGHEMFHLLGLDSAPLWAAESLAHYYGYKSMKPGEEVERMFDELVEDLPAMGLLEAQRRVTHQGERQFYGLFYSRGAAFWRVLDEQISEATGGERDLDAFLPMLREHDFGRDGQLPAAFIDAMGDLISPSTLDHLMNEYL